MRTTLNIDADVLQAAKELAASEKTTTDIYLLGLASQSAAKLATFDGNIPIQAVNGATEAHLEVIR